MSKGAYLDKLTTNAYNVFYISLSLISKIADAVAVAINLKFMAWDLITFIPLHFIFSPIILSRVPITVKITIFHQGNKNENRFS